MSIRENIENLRLKIDAHHPDDEWRDFVERIADVLSQIAAEQERLERSIDSVNARVESGLNH